MILQSGASFIQSPAGIAGSCVALIATAESSYFTLSSRAKQILEALGKWVLWW